MLYVMNEIWSSRIDAKGHDIARFVSVDCARKLKITKVKINRTEKQTLLVWNYSK